MNILIDAIKAKSKKSAILRWISFLAMSILSVCLVVLGVIRLFQGCIFTFSYLIIYFWVPIAVIIRSFCWISSDTSVAGKTVICVLLILLLLFNTFIFTIFSSHKQLKSYHGEIAIEKYTENYFEEMKLPEISNLGGFLNFEYYYYEYFNLICNPGTHIIICSYDAETYEIQKEKINTTYYFQEEKINTTEPQVTIDGYKYRMLSNEAYFNYFPKDVAFIATNDSTNEIVYMSYCNVELDYIKSTEEFILNECGWQYIR